MNSLRILNEVGKAEYEDSKDEDISAKLQKIMLQIKVLGEEERMAFFIKVKDFWKSVAYNIAGYIFTLDDIEHGILRGNKPHPASPSPLFSEADPRLQFSMNHFDPRIHFALVCGAKSCPAINIYSAKNLQRGLRSAAKNFCSQAIQIDLQIHQVKLSKIFLWYKADFGNTDMDLLRWILPYLSDQVYHDLEKLLNDSSKQGKHTLSVSYADYDWKLNSIVVNI